MRTLAFIIGLSLMACTNPNPETKESADAASIVEPKSGAQEKGPYLDIPVAELKKQLELREPGSYILLDVRTPEEVSKGKITGAVAIDFYNNFTDSTADLDEEKEIFIYCAAGGRSAKASELLAKKDFPQVHNILGGFGAWTSSGFPIEK